ncbi:MAG: gephyrin-like molybdotransferase Glp [Candidatus Omnitrophota bacterium]
MILAQQALQIILRHTNVRLKEDCNFLASLGRTLAQDVKSKNDLPAFDRSLRDGFALRSVDTRNANPKNPLCFRLIDTVFAGKPSRKRIGPKEAIRIMTGGVIPKGADAVIMKEDTRLEGQQVNILESVKKKENIAFQGEDIKKNKTIIPEGTVIHPGIISLLACLGQAHVRVFRKPTVAILATGNELIGLKKKPKQGQVRSSNQYALFAQILQCGAQPIILGIAKDSPQELIKKIKQGLKSDMLLVSGGVSVGESDFVPLVLKQLKARIVFHKVAIKPGKPLLFAHLGKTLIFGLPGNPASTMVSFNKFVRPCLAKMSGQKSFCEKSAQAILAQDVHEEKERRKVMRGLAFEKNGQLYVRLAHHQGSGNILSMAGGNCLFEIKEGVRELSKGTRVKITYLW